jgi:hypothetical protein
LGCRGVVVGVVGGGGALASGGGLALGGHSSGGDRKVPAARNEDPAIEGKRSRYASERPLTFESCNTEPILRDTPVRASHI